MWKHHPAALTSLNHQGRDHVKNVDDHDDEGDDNDEVKDIDNTQARGEVVELGGLSDAEPTLKVR